MDTCVFFHLPFIQSAVIFNNRGVYYRRWSYRICYFRPCCIMRGRCQPWLTGMMHQSQNRSCRNRKVQPINAWSDVALSVPSTRDFQSALFTIDAIWTMDVQWFLMWQTRIINLKRTNHLHHDASSNLTASLCHFPYLILVRCWQVYSWTCSMCANVLISLH